MVADGMLRYRAIPHLPFSAKFDQIWCKKSRKIQEINENTGQVAKLAIFVASRLDFVYFLTRFLSSVFPDNDVLLLLATQIR